MLENELMKSGHRFEYEITRSDIPEVHPRRVIVELSGEPDLPSILEAFTGYLKAVGYFPPEDSTLKFVQDQKSPRIGYQPSWWRNRVEESEIQ